MNPDCPLCACLTEPGPLTPIAVLEQTAVFLNDQQGCRGWCVCVLRRHVEHMDGLTLADQAQVFAEVARVARAIRTVFPSSGAGGGPPRINYECLGNVTAHVHWHVIPRHAGDPTPRAPVWGWDAPTLKGGMGDAERRAWAEKVRAALPITG